LTAYIHLSVAEGFRDTVHVTSATVATVPIEAQVVHNGLVPQPALSLSNVSAFCPNGDCLSASVSGEWGIAGELQFGGHLSVSLLGQEVGGHVGDFLTALGGASTTGSWAMMCAGVRWDAEATLNAALVAPAFPLASLFTIAPQISGTLFGPWQLATFGKPPSRCPAKEAVTAIAQSSTPGIFNPTVTYQVRTTVSDAQGTPVPSLPVVYSAECKTGLATWLQFALLGCGSLGSPAVRLTDNSGIATDSLTWQPGYFQGLFATPVVTATVYGIDDNNSIKIPLASTATSTTPGGSATAGGAGTLTPQVSATASGGEGTVRIHESITRAV
jgi:hypothetical protein